MLPILMQAATDTAETAAEAAEPTTNIFVQMLEKGGIPGLAIFVCFTILMAYLKNRAKVEAAGQKERAEARKRDAEQFDHLLSAYEELVNRFAHLSERTAVALTQVKERVAMCPNRGPTVPVVVDDAEDSNDS